MTSRLAAAWNAGKLFAICACKPRSASVSWSGFSKLEMVRKRIASLSRVAAPSLPTPPSGMAAPQSPGAPPVRPARNLKLPRAMGENIERQHAGEDGYGRDHQQRDVADDFDQRARRHFPFARAMPSSIS